ncbi:hypothetical protein CDAR_117611 [Caerostris darwini]|uniref:Uncharacterized protein n=1 Tax=Caerostris darwini TaxID=1538125 RepID=A0AAV4WLB8_9ARAC|nr:hypothetical protein CDAR_117611 [Caerostris darwini]
MRRHLLVADRADHFISGNRIIFSQLPLRSYLLPFNKRFHSGLCVILSSRLLLINSFPPLPFSTAPPRVSVIGSRFWRAGSVVPGKKNLSGDRDWMYGAICNGATTEFPTWTARASTYLAGTVFGPGNLEHLIKKPILLEFFVRGLGEKQIKKPSG